MNVPLTVKAPVPGSFPGRCAVHRAETVSGVGGKRRKERGRDGNTAAGQDHSIGYLHILAVRAGRKFCRSGFQVEAKGVFLAKGDMADLGFSA
jgi:hypothetical protein